MTMSRIEDEAIIANLNSPYDDMTDESYRSTIAFELDHYRDERGPNFPLSELVEPLQFAAAREVARIRGDLG